MDTLWKGTMEGIVTENGIMELADKDNIKQLFEIANKNLDKIQKSLNDYLQQKREVFPRFYFMANEDLLMLLGPDQRTQSCAATHGQMASKASSRVIFNDNDEVLGMISAE